MNLRRIIVDLIKGADQSRNFRTHKIIHSLPPVTPGASYICENCGMFIVTGHGHTREECADYYAHSPSAPIHLRKRPFNPDHRVTSTVFKGRNDPKVRRPYYHEPGTFQNWGKGK